jgi:hypothetical protein
LRDVHPEPFDTVRPEALEGTNGAQDGPKPFDSPFVLSLSKDERIAQDRLVEMQKEDRK